MKAIIKEPCTEDWNKMQITMHSRHCLKCDKHLVDFTTYSRAEIIAYLLSNPVGSVCGKMSRLQIDLHIDDYPALMEVLKQPRFQSKAFMILALVGASFFSSCEQASNVRGNVSISNANHLTISAFQKGKKVNAKPKKKIETQKKSEIKITKLRENKIPEVIDNPIDTGYGYGIGDIVGVVSMVNREIENSEMIRDEPRIIEDAPVLNPEVNAEFPGGFTKMLEYLKQNLEYPAEEQNKGIQGKVIVRFVVKSNGELENFEIAKGVLNGKSLELEAIRVIQQMPKWLPAQNEGYSVSQYMTLPIDFTLN
jgi:TonB family protein